MARKHCTALIRDLGPDRPTNSPPVTFLSLSREIRDEIYDLALVSASPIIVWKGSWKAEFYDYSKIEGLWGSGPRLWRHVEKEAISTSLRPLAVNLILCNKTVSHEAAGIFYTRNTFSFMGEHNWDPIVSWLKKIGPANRNSLASMEINAYRPDPVWQRSNGERIEEPACCTREEIYPRHPYLQLHTTEEHLRYGQVDNINPAVETVFVLLGEKTSEQKVKIVMQLPVCLYPGARTPRNRYDTRPQGGWYSMDLPNLIEKFRSLHTQLVEVLWKGEECRKELEDQQAIMESIGWDIDVLPDTEDELYPNPQYHGCHPATDEWRIAKYVLRRKELTGPLWAQDPCPYHHVSLESLPNVM